PVEPRQHDVEHEHVVVLAARPLETVHSIAGKRHRMAFRLQPADDETPDAFVILDQQQVHQAAIRSAMASGSSITARVPGARRGSIKALPPCASTRARTRLSPRPEPSPSVSPRLKRSNRRSTSAGGIPGPSSQTAITAPASLR